MGGQGPSHQFCVALGESNPLEEPLLVGVDLTRHPEAVGLRRVNPKRATRLTIHAHRLGHIGAEAHGLEDCCQVIEVPL